MHMAKDVAYYFLALTNEEDGDLISPLKMQKLVYFAQGFSMVLLGKKLFDESVEAWRHGPVIPSLYREFKQFGDGAIAFPPSGVDLSVFSRDERSLLDEVYKVYGQYSAWRLREITHQEGPWKDCYIDGKRDIVIPDEEIKKYFKTQIVD